MYIIGISAYFHDSAVALVQDGKIVAAAQEERFTRVKHDANFPSKALQFLVDKFELSAENIDSVVFYEKPFLKLERLLETYLATAPFGFKQFRKAIPIWVKEKLFLRRELSISLKGILPDLEESKLRFAEHHISHAASAFYPSPYEEALVITFDGVGEWNTSTVSIAKGSKIEIKQEMNFPHSLGLLYSAFTQYIGFKVNSGEYKVMGLAPYGKPKFVDAILGNIIDLKEDGSFSLNKKYFEFLSGEEMINRREFQDLFGQPVRQMNSDEVSQFHMDIAASIQAVTERVVLQTVRHFSNKYNQKNLCLAGGVALNCVANGKILDQKLVENLWIQPAAGDAGGAIGAALALYFNEFENERIIEENDSMFGAYLGPEFDDPSIQTFLDTVGAVYQKYEFEDLTKSVAKIIEEGNVVGWFQGRMEFGPRALGNRSIIADPRNLKMQKTLNLKIKYRESFRPFAPAILEEKREEWFELNLDSPYMLLVTNVKQKHLKKQPKNKKFGLDLLNQTRSSIPAVTHVDNSARVQTVSPRTNKKFYELINEFYKLTQTPILINTSFNVRGEPIVNTPEDAFKCFMNTEMDYLAIGGFLLDKKKQDSFFIDGYQNKFELD